MSNEKPQKSLGEITEDDAVEIWASIGGTPHLFDIDIVKNWLISGEVDGFYLDAFTMRQAIKKIEELGYDICLEPYDK